jgi:acetyltransferase-like isoleucine patch superfamily enzyme
VLAPLRRLRLILWRAALRARLRRHGVRLKIAVGRDVRVAGRPGLDIEIHGARRGGSVTIAVGDHVRIGRGAVLDVLPGRDSVVELGLGAALADHVRLVLRGGAIRLADHVHLRDGCELKAAGELTLGAHALCTRGASVHCDERVAIGAHAVLAERVTVIDSDHTHDGSDTWLMEQPLRVEPVEIADNVLVGANSVVLRGARVARNSVIAAGSVVVAGDYPPATLLAGVPACPVKTLAR